MFKNVQNSSHRSLEIGGWRLNQALDILLDYIIELEGESEDQLSETPVSDDGFKSASKSERLILLPPPDLSS